MWSPSFTVAPWNLGTCSENKTTDLASVTLLLRGFSPNTVHTVHRKSEECMWHAANHRFNPQAASGDSVSAETDTRTRDFLWIWGLFMPQWPSSHRHSRTHEHKQTYKDSCTDTHTHTSLSFPVLSQIGSKPQSQTIRSTLLKRSKTPRPSWQEWK